MMNPFVFKKVPEPLFGFELKLPKLEYKSSILEELGLDTVSFLNDFPNKEWRERTPPVKKKNEKKEQAKKNNRN